MKLFLDDVRQPPDESWAVARTYAECIRVLKTGAVESLSLDHDLGESRTGYDVACWIEAAVILEGFNPPKITVHSANPVGRRNIEACIGAIERSLLKRS